jgi:hypothetical protein
MPAASFPATFEVYALGLAQVVGLTTSWAFGSRYFFKRHASMNLVACLAALLTLGFSTFALTLWFDGVGDVDCKTIQVGELACAARPIPFSLAFLEAIACVRCVQSGAG